MDPLKGFIDACCIVAPSDKSTWISIDELWGTYVDWARVNADAVIKRTEFNEAMEALGCKRSSRNSGKTRVWLGIKLNNCGVTIDNE